jgi:hypothetical protein
MDTFPFDSWEQAGQAAPDAGFFTFGEVGAVVLVVIMIILTFLAFIGWVRVEGRKLDEQARRLRAAAGGEG